MGVLSVLHIFAGIAFALFIPGYLAAMLLFRDLNLAERIAVGIVLSIGFDILLGIFLGYDRWHKQLTGGITSYNLWFFILTLSAILGTLVLFRIFGGPAMSKTLKGRKQGRL